MQCSPRDDMPLVFIPCKKRGPENLDYAAQTHGMRSSACNSDSHQAMCRGQSKHRAHALRNCVCPPMSFERRAPEHARGRLSQHASASAPTPSTSPHSHRCPMPLPGARGARRLRLEPQFHTAWTSASAKHDPVRSGRVVKSIHRRQRLSRCTMPQTVCADENEVGTRLRPVCIGIAATIAQPRHDGPRAKNQRPK